MEHNSPYEICPRLWNNEGNLNVKKIYSKGWHGTTTCKEKPLLIIGMVLPVTGRKSFISKRKTV